MKTVIKNAKIIIGNGLLIEKGSIAFDETGILDIGEGVFEGDEVIDAAGKTVAPGFIDCHIHLGTASYPWTHGLFEEYDEVTVGIRACYQAQALLKSGITSVRVVGTKYGADLQLRTMVENGEIKAPRILAAGEVICITAGHGSEMGTECDTVGEVLKAARTRVKQRANVIKLMPTSGIIGIGPSTEVQLSEEQIKAACDVGRAFNTPTCAHVMNYPAIGQCVKAGLTSVEHGYELDEAAAKMMVEHGTWYIPTAVVTRNESIYIPADYLPGADMKAKAAIAQQSVQNAVRVAIKAGVKMAVGTDTGCPYTDPEHFAYAEELAIYKNCGMDPMDVFVCATKNGAELLRISDKVGTLEARKIADLIIIDGDPLRDITDARKVERVYRSGKLYYEA
ncbi:putative Amidohydrolase [uncultured Sporomusa sp.]|uniref:Putative Amidohydrolase n=1 Tax=uncultured Sporomusa sp. TaxID=307249 RepID=A0A212LV56_9FIRM|nr:amidohydrolase family protein [uncultured Sporomusa sp.]SCM81396.1 putative Amidohydrolase [uncultured Sporomusa sp.]